MKESGTINGDLPEIFSHTFVMRIWLEETAEEAGYARWRGKITHISSKKEKYIKNLNEIKAFILPYLRNMDIEIT